MAEQVIGRSIEADPTGTYITTPHQSWRLVDYGEAGMVSEDPVFGAHMIGTTDVDKVVADLMRTDAFYRSFDIAQLSKLEGEGAIPNITLFSTAGGNVGQLPFIRFVADTLKRGDKAYLAYVIAQSITDVSHGPLRHVTDMEAEGLHGRQIFHEARKEEVYEHGGIYDVFAKHGIRLGKNGNMPRVPIPPAIESSSPHINADNYQYVIAEIYEWFAGQQEHPDADVAVMCESVVRRLRHLGEFRDVIEIDSDGHVVFKDPSDALFFQKCQMLASTEDWKEPIARVLTHQYVEDLKYHKIVRSLPNMDEIDNGFTLHPHDYMSYVDSNIITAQRSTDANDRYLYVSRNLKKHISQEERERFVSHKIRRYAEFLCDELAVDYPNESINGHVVKYGPASSRVEIVHKVDVDPSEPISSAGAALAPDEMQTPESITYILDPLKNRVVQPFVRNERGQRVFLSQLDGRLGTASKTLLRQHQQLQWQRLTVRLVATRDYADALKDAYKQVEEDYKELLSRPRMSPDQVRRSLGFAALSAKTKALSSGLLVIAA